MTKKETFIDKPWGSEEILEINEKYMLKRLTMLKGHRCSLQYHNHKKETIYVLSGVLRVVQGETKDNLIDKVYYPGDFFTVPSRLIHRMEGVEDSIYLEASTPELDDVVRLVDDYDRTMK